MKINTNKTTYDKLENVLLRNGFYMAGQKGNNSIYTHKSIDSIIVLPNKSSNEIINPVHVIAIKRALIDNGLIDQDQFDYQLNNSGNRLNRFFLKRRNKLGKNRKMTKSI